MIDHKLLKNNPTLLADILTSRGKLPEKALDKHQDYLRKVNLAQALQTEMNAKSKRFGELKAKGKDTQELKDELRWVKAQLEDANHNAVDATDNFFHFLSTIPNIISEDVPYGKDEASNAELYKWGNIPNILNPKDHVDIGGLEMDFETGGKLSGSRFVVLKNKLARLERALGQFMLDVHTKEHGYMECSVPLLVREESMFGTGQLPKFEEDLFKAGNHYLIPTAEVSLTNMFREQILVPDDLPLRLTALTHCFRAEAGSAGRDTRGLIRQHQFQKVELVSIVTPDKSKEEHERMLGCAENILKKLELPFRTMLLCSGDMGFSAQKTYDIEVWIPSQDKYREISSVSNCGDFQARRMKTRVKINGSNEFVHTLNGSGLAVGRTLVAILENYQTIDGDFDIPTALQKYM